MTASGLPFVFVLDWDGTIVGNVNFQSERHRLLQTLSKTSLKVKANSAMTARIPKAFQPNSLLIRPGFCNFLTRMTDFFDGHVKFFIYTASERQWALKEIAWVEKSHNIKFEKPIFTRDDCIKDPSGAYKKSLMNILPRIFRSLGRGRTSLTKGERDYLVEHQLMIIDNNAVYRDFQHRLLLCPDYDYTFFENILEDLPANVLQHPSIQPYLQALASEGVLCPYPGNNIQDDHHKALMNKYQWMAVKCRGIYETNRIYAHDTFWKTLYKLIKKNGLRDFPSDVLKKLQARVWDRHNKRLTLAPTATKPPPSRR